MPAAKNKATQLFKKYQTETLLPFQRGVINCPAKITAVVKSRRIGVSWSLAYYAAMRAYFGIGDTLYMCHKRSATKGFIDDCASHLKAIGAMAFPDGRYSIEKDGGEVLNYELKLPKGKIKTVSSEPSSFRSEGREGTLFIIDEAAYIENFDEVWKAVEPVKLTFGEHGKIIVVSTHNGAENEFNKLIMSIERGGEEWGDAKVHRIPFMKAAEDGAFAKFMAKSRGEAPTLENAKKYLDSLIAKNRASADEEYNCIPLGAGHKFIPRDVVNLAAVDDLKVVRWSAPVGFEKTPIDRAAKIVDDWYDLNVARFTRKGATCFIGCDIGRKQDLTSICLARVANGKLIANFVELALVPFMNQEQILHRIIRELDDNKIYGGAAIDGRGSGAAVAEKTEQLFGFVSIVMATDKWYSKYFTALRDVFEDRTVQIPADNEIIDDLCMVELSKGIPKLPNVRARKKSELGTRHGDAAISLCFANAAVIDNHKPAQPVALKEDDRYSDGIDFFLNREDDMRGVL